MNKNTVQNIIYRVIVMMSSSFRVVMRKFAIMDRYERLVAIAIWLLFFIILVFPLIKASPNDMVESGSRYVFLLTETSLWKSFICIEGSLALLLLWLFNNRFKTFVVESLWFQGNDYLFTTLLLLITISSIFTLWEVVSFLSNYTMILTFTPLYYVVQILLILVIAWCMYMIFAQPTHRFRGHVVWYHGKKDDREQQSDGSLFDSLHHDEH